MHRNIIRRTLPLLILGSFAFLVYWLDVGYQLQGDDTVYGAYFDSVTRSVRHISSIREAFYRSFIVDGHRPVVHFFTRLFCGHWRAAFPIVNALMAFSLLLLVLKNARVVTNWKNASLVTFFSLLVLCTGETMVFIAGSCNYLWTAVATLVFCLFVHRIETERVAWPLVALMAFFSFIIGWMNEAFTLSVGFALFICTLINFKKISWRNVIVYGGYACGLALLVVLNLRLKNQELNTVHIPGARDIATVVKYCWAAKIVDLVLVLSIFRDDKKRFFIRNQFELLTIIGSFILVLFVGFDGDRMIYIANVMALVVLIREWTPSTVIGFTSLGVYVLLAGLVLNLNRTISANSRHSVETYVNSSDGVYCMEKIGYPFWRFYFQDFPSWGENKDCHKISVSTYYASVTNKIPIGLPRRLYDELYVNNEFCNPSNRIEGVDIVAYTSHDVNAIVLPLAINDKTDWSKYKYSVNYEDVGSVNMRLCEKWHQWHDIEIRPDHPVVLKTPRAKYLLIGKKRGCEARICGIKLILCDE